MKLSKLIMHDYWYCFTLIALAERKLNHINTKRFHNAKLTLISDYSLFVILKDLAIERFLLSWVWAICRQHEPTLCKWNTIPVMRSLQVTTWNEFLANHDITESFQTEAKIQNRRSASNTARYCDTKCLTASLSERKWSLWPSRENVTFTTHRACWIMRLAYNLPSCCGETGLKLHNSKQIHYIQWKEFHWKRCLQSQKDETPPVNPIKLETNNLLYKDWLNYAVTKSTSVEFKTCQTENQQLKLKF